MKYRFEINDRAFKAIKNGTKRVEIRTSFASIDKFDYGLIKPKDIIEFKSSDNQIIRCLVKEINHYDTIEKLLMFEGTRYTLSSTNDFEKGVKSINSLSGYKEAIKKYGVYAIHIKYINML